MNVTKFLREICQLYLSGSVFLTVNSWYPVFRIAFFICNFFLIFGHQNTSSGCSKKLGSGSDFVNPDPKHCWQEEDWFNMDLLGYAPARSFTVAYLESDTNSRKVGSIKKGEKISYFLFWRGREALYGDKYFTFISSPYRYSFKSRFFNSFFVKCLLKDRMQILKNRLGTGTS